MWLRAMSSPPGVVEESIAAKSSRGQGVRSICSVRASTPS